MKYKREIHMKIDVPWPFLSESVACTFTPLYQIFTKITIRNVCPLTKNEHFLSAVFEKIIISI